MRGTDAFFFGLDDDAFGGEAFFFLASGLSSSSLSCSCLTDADRFDAGFFGLFATALTSGLSSSESDSSLVDFAVSDFFFFLIGGRGAGAGEAGFEEVRLERGTSSSETSPSPSPPPLAGDGSGSEGSTLIATDRTCRVKNIQGSVKVKIRWERGVCEGLRRGGRRAERGSGKRELSSPDGGPRPQPPRPRPRRCSRSQPCAS